MFDERHYSAMAGEPEDAENRMNMANELAAASSEEAEEFVENYAKEVSAKLAAGELSNEDLDLLEAKIRDIRESKGH